MPNSPLPRAKPVGLTLKLPWQTEDEFVAKFSQHLSDNGMFVRTSDPKPRATELAFKVMLADGRVVLQGTGISRYVRGENDPLGPPGMGVEFLSLDPNSRALVNRMLGRGVPAPAAAPAPAPRPSPVHSSPSADDLFRDVFGTKPAPPPADLEFGANFSDPEVFDLLNAGKKR